MNQGKTKLTVRLPKQLLNAVTALAAQAGASVSAMATQMLMTEQQRRAAAPTLAPESLATTAPLGSRSADCGAPSPLVAPSS